MSDKPSEQPTVDEAVRLLHSGKTSSHALPISQAIQALLKEGMKKKKKKKKDKEQAQAAEAADEKAKGKIGGVRMAAWTHVQQLLRAPPQIPQYCRQNMMHPSHLNSVSCLTKM